MALEFNFKINKIRRENNRNCVTVADVDFYIAKDGALNMPVLRVFGYFNGTQKCCVHVHNVLPYFYVPCKHENPSLSEISSICTEMQSNINSHCSQKMSRKFTAVHSVIPVKARNMYGFHSMPQIFLKISLFYPDLVGQVSKFMSEEFHTFEVSKY